MTIAHILRRVCQLALAPRRPAATPLVLLDAATGLQLGAFARVTGPDGQLHAVRIRTSAAAASDAPITSTGNLNRTGNR